MSAHIAVGVDVGGTFTDVLLLDRSTGSFRVAKVPSTPVAGQDAGFMQGIEATGANLREVGEVIHGTTVATNALLERKGARCGLIATKGFRDLIELGRRTRPEAYGMIGYFEPLIDRSLRVEVTERLDPFGAVVTPLDEDEVRVQVRRLLAQGAETLVIHFLNAYANPVHEQRCAAIARELWPNEFVTTGSAILAEMREFERGSTAAANGYVQPRVTGYIRNIARRLKEAGFENELLITQGNGGTMGAALRADHAVRTVMSGPAAGAVAAAELARQAGCMDVITGDMGGTSFDVSLIVGGRPTLSSEKDLAYNIPIRIPMVDIHTIGAGGGSIAHVGTSGLLNVGPESAGASPGPIGFGRGGAEPTVTDANLLLGRLNAEGLNGAAPANLHAIEKALDESIGKRLGLSALQAAAAIIKVANVQMAAAIRLVSVSRGHDPRNFAYLPFGGAGPLHAVELAREIGIPKVLVPRFPGLTSALGCLIADLRHDFVQSVNRPLLEMKTAEIETVLQQQAEAGRILLAEEGVSLRDTDFIHEADLHYSGQVHVLRLSLDSARQGPEEIRHAFGAAFFARFKIDLPGMTIMLSDLRTAVIGRRPSIDLAILGGAQAATSPQAQVSRKVWFDDAFVETPVFRRDQLGPGSRIAGPAIVEQLDTTIVMDPRTEGVVDRLGNLLIDILDVNGRKQ
jgi:N-methylhydantoinase A